MQAPKMIVVIVKGTFGTFKEIKDVIIIAVTPIIPNKLPVLAVLGDDKERIDSIKRMQDTRYEMLTNIIIIFYP